ncbi:nucleotide disphospho-sugar-binding domain-containing protein [Amycolatopsis sp. NPDC057786]|uniref:nucleotide disphospho-sugar-binding domain-containing protein n=1 Tax=Amycolatopsis sp. NPDC057786 TaxID=3346250 RepID=UPI003670EB98
MMDCVFVPYTAHGHVNPMLPVVGELVARGHRVRVVLSGTRFEDVVRRTGAEPVVSPPDHVVRVAPTARPPEIAAWIRNRTHRRLAWSAAARRCEREFAAARPDLVIADPMVPWARRLARRHALPVVTFWTTHAGTAAGSGPALVNALPELQPRAHRFSFVGPLIAPVTTEDCPAPDGPTLLVSPGTVFARTPEFFRRIARAFSGTEWTVLIATSHTPPSALGPLPDNVIARRWLPQRQLLPRVDAFLTHGGMNSVQEALAHGARMLVAPRSREQRATARRLAELGLAHVWDPATSLVPGVERLLRDGRVLANTTSMRSRLATYPAASLAADALQAANGKC